MTLIYKTLIEIKENQAFEKLESFRDSTIWSKMTTEERDLLAHLWIMHGAQQLAKGHPKVLESFELAVQVTPSASLFYEQGKVFASYSENIRCLNWADQAFTQATERDSTFFVAWYQGALILMKLGLFDGESHYFLEAHQKFEKAFRLIDMSLTDVAKGEFYWQWGCCLSLLGKYSGEPIDLYKAIGKYQLAADLGCQQAVFFHDHGQALAELASLLERPEFFLEALKLFDQAIKQAPGGFDSWYSQACCLYRLSEITNHEDYLEQAELSFKKASEINPNYSQLWLKWGQLEAMVGKLKRDQKKIEGALEKLERASHLEPDHALTLSCWGEVELFLGAYEENLDLIRSAKLKIIKSLELQPDNADSWYLYGSCLNELGRYFAEEKFYHQAIEKFQYGLSLSRQNPLLWYGLALAHFALGELSDDMLFIEKAARYCGRVIECGGGVMAQFWNDWGVSLMKLAEMTNQQAPLEAAIEKFERALQQPLFDVEYEDIDLEWVYNYGCAFDLLGDLTEDPRHFEKAAQILVQVLQLDPNYSHARYNLALAYSHLGEITSDIDYYYKALEHFQILLEYDPEDELAQMDLGVSLINLALLVQEAYQPDRAQVLYRQAEHHLIQATSLGNCQAYYQLAGLYSLTHHYSQAMHYIERAQFFGVLPGVEDLLHDEWLEGLRQTPSFRQFLNQLSSQQSKEDK